MCICIHAVNCFFVELLTTLKGSSMRQGFGATGACGAGCAQHWVAYLVLHVRLMFTSPLCKCGEVNFLHSIHACYRVRHKASVFVRSYVAQE